jgi:hypothetical protein
LPAINSFFPWNFATIGEKYGYFFYYEAVSVSVELGASFLGSA